MQSSRPRLPSSPLYRNLHLPKQVDTSDLVNGNALLHPSEIATVKKSFQHAQKQTENSLIQRLTVHTKKGKIPKLTILKLFDPDNNEAFFAMYYGQKHGKQLGAGANGKVKLMQNIETLEWVGIKVFNIPVDDEKARLRDIDRERRNLTLLKRTQGNLLHRKIVSSTTQYTKYYLALDFAQGDNLKKAFLTHGKIELNPSLNQQQEITNPDIHTTYLYKTKSNSDAAICQYYNTESTSWEKKMVNPLEQDENLLGILQQHNTSLQSLSCTGISQLQNKPLYDDLSTYFKIPVTPHTATHSTNQLIEISSGMINALQTVHAAGIVHRDVKPEQFIVDETKNTVTLIDLGSGITADDDSLFSFLDGITTAYASLDLIKHSQTNTSWLIKKNMQADWLSKHETGTEADFEDYWLKNTDFSLYFYKKLDCDFNGTNAVQYEEEKKQYYQSSEYQSFLSLRNHHTTEAKKKLKTFNFTPAYDIYCLGLSIGQLFGFTDIIHTRDHFGLDQPPYLNPPFQGSKFSTILQIKSIDGAKKNNPYQLPDSLLEELINFLSRMTHADAAKRPSLDEARQFFKSLKLKHASLAASEKHTEDQVKKRISLLPMALFNSIQIPTYTRESTHLLNDDETITIEKHSTSDISTNVALPRYHSTTHVLNESEATSAEKRSATETHHHHCKLTKKKF